MLSTAADVAVILVAVVTVVGAVVSTVRWFNNEIRPLDLNITQSVKKAVNELPEYTLFSFYGWFLNPLFRTFPFFESMNNLILYRISKNIEIEKEGEIKINTESVPSLEYQLQISQKFDLNIKLKQVDLRFGFNRNGSTFQSISLSSRDGNRSPRNIQIDDRIGESRKLIIELVPPKYVFFSSKGRTIFIDGTVTMETIFGDVEMPVSSTVRLTDDQLENEGASARDYLSSSFGR